MKSLTLASALSGIPIQCQLERVGVRLRKLATFSSPLLHHSNAKYTYKSKRQEGKKPQIHVACMRANIRAAKALKNAGQEETLKQERQANKNAVATKVSQYFC